MTDSKDAKSLNIDAMVESKNLVTPEEAKRALEAAEQGKPREVNVACRRGMHVEGRPGASSGDGDQTQSCDSKRAIVLSDTMETAQGHVVYRCVKCNYSWSASVGGHFPY